MTVSAELAGSQVPRDVLPENWQGLGMIIAMLVGGAVYDPVFLNHLAAGVGLSLHLEVANTLRFPIFLNLITAVLALAVVLGLREPSVRATSATGGQTDAPSESASGAWGHVFSAGRWIASRPVALFIIVGGVTLDSVTRLLLTFSSSYFRLIQLPEATYGIIGAGMAGLGIVISPVARGMVARFSLGSNFVMMAALTLAALTGVALQVPLWGVAFVLALAAAMMVMGYMNSYYLNALVESHHRATVLSFKGVAINLGYGFISLLFALALRAFRDGEHADAAVSQGFRLLPLWLAFTLVVLALSFWKQRAVLSQKY